MSNLFRFRFKFLVKFRARTSMANAIKLNKKTYFVVTGASRGIGQAMAIENSSKMLPGSVVMLLARNGQDLESTKEQILRRNAQLQVDTYAVDLSHPNIDEMKQNFRMSFDKSNGNFELAYIIHNVGSVGDVTKKAKDLNNIEVLRTYYDLNVFSVATLNSVFMDMFKETKKVVVNITSKCGIVPFESFALYSSGKAAREMFFKVLAVEEKDVLVLNYSPGPIDTDMTVDVQANSCSPDIQSMFKELRDANTILTPLQTTMRYLEILENGNYTSGDHVDFYD